MGRGTVIAKRSAPDTTRIVDSAHHSAWPTSSWPAAVVERRRPDQPQDLARVGPRDVDHPPPQLAPLPKPVVAGVVAKAQEDREGEADQRDHGHADERAPSRAGVRTLPTLHGRALDLGAGAGRAAGFSSGALAHRGGGRGRTARTNGAGSVDLQGVGVRSRARVCEAIGFDQRWLRNRRTNFPWIQPWLHRISRGEPWRSLRSAVSGAAMGCPLSRARACTT